MSKNGHYQPMTDEELQSEALRLNEIVLAFLNANGYDPKNVFVDETSIFQIITRIHKRKQYYLYFHNLDVSDLKELGLYCFWIVKLRPLSRKNENDSPETKADFESINEKFAVYNIITKLRSLLPENKTNSVNAFFSNKYIYELVYSFTYRDISKEAMILLVETIAIALNIDPYNSK